MSHLMKVREEAGSAIFIAPMLMLMVIYLTGFFVDLGDAFTKASNMDQALALAAASATTQISQADFYQGGNIALDVPRAQELANAKFLSAMATGTSLASVPHVVISGAAVCIRAREQIKLPFAFVPGVRPSVTYSSSSTALARGYTSTSVPTC